MAGEDLQQLRGGPVDEVEAAQVVLGQLVGVGRADQRDGRPPVAYGPGQLGELGGAADHVDQHIDTVRMGREDLVGERARGVVDGLRGAQRAHQLRLGRAGGGDHLGAAAGRELGGEGADAAGRADDQHPLALGDPGLLDEVVRGHAGRRQRRGGGVGDAAGGVREAALIGDGEFAVRAAALLRPLELAEHRVADGEPPYTVPDREHLAGPVRPEDEGEADRHGIPEHAIGELPVDGVESGGGQPHQNLTGPWFGLRQIHELRLFTECADCYGSHRGVPFHPSDRWPKWIVSTPVGPDAAGGEAVRRKQLVRPLTPGLSGPRSAPRGRRAPGPAAGAVGRPVPRFAPLRSPAGSSLVNSLVRGVATKGDCVAERPASGRYDAMRVLVVEAEELLADMIAAGLRRAAIAVDIVHDGRAAPTALRLGAYDVLVLDHDLPGLPGDEICRQMAEQGLPTRVLMLTAPRTARARGRRTRVRRADDRLTKPFVHEELLARVLALGRRARPALPQIIERAGVTVDTARRLAVRDGRPLALSRTEFGVLEVLLRAQGAVVSGDELIEEVWEEHTTYRTNAVRVTLGKLRAKLGDPPVIETVPDAVAPGQREDQLGLERSLDVDVQLGLGHAREQLGQAGGRDGFGEVVHRSLQ